MAKQPQNSESTDGQKHTVYPYYSLEKAISVAEIVRDLGGMNKEVQKSQIAHSLQMEESSTALPAILGASRLYRLIDGRGSYRLTEIAKHYFYPTNDSEKTMAMLQMVKGPPLFSALIDRFDGIKLPSAAALINILHREHGISESWQSRAASMFFGSMREANLIDAGGFLRYKATLAGAGNGNMDAMSSALTQIGTPSIDPPPAPPSGPVEARARSGVAGWTYKGIRVEVPENITMDLWKKLSDYVNVLKPDAEDLSEK